MNYLWVLIIQLAAASLISAAPVVRTTPAFVQKLQNDAEKRTTTQKSVDDMDKAMTYLNQFGYMDHTHETTTQQLNNFDEGQASDIPDAVRNALMKFQAMANIPQTGELDEKTMSMMALPRCGVSDHVPSSAGGGAGKRKKRFALGGSKWPTNRVTYNISSYPKAGLGLSNSDVSSTVQRALKFWSDASSLSFVETPGSSTDILMNFFARDHGDGSPFDGPGGVLAHNFYPGQGILGDLHWDGEETWTINTPNGINLLYVTVHELGHALGLAHSSDPTAVMAPFYRNYDPNLVLTQDDINGIQNLYGPPISTTSMPSTTTTMKPTTATTRTTTTTSPTTTTSLPTSTILRRSTPPVTTPNSKSGQNAQATSWCQDATFDAVTVIKGSTFLFKGDSYVMLNSAGNGIADGYPKLISSYWPGAPSNIDAALYWEDLDQTYFFKGNKVWRYNTGLLLDPWYPKPIGDKFYDLAGPIDAAFIWNGDQDTYFISGHQYYRYNRASSSVYSGYPRPLTDWVGLPQSVNAAMRWTNNKTYFFSGTNFYQYNDQLKKVDAGYPQSSRSVWLGC